jgi:hypothetical protein
MTAAAVRTLLDVGEIARMLDARADTLARELLPDGRRAGHEWVARNPWRADRKPGSFSVHLSGAKSGLWRDFAADEHGDMLDLVAKTLFGGDKKSAIQWALRWLHIENGDPAAIAQVRRATPTAAERDHEAEREAADRRQAAFRIWLTGLKELRDTPVDRYLAGRGILLNELRRVPRSIRFHQGLWHKPSEKKWPAMVTYIAGADGHFGACHRTWLEIQSDGSVRKAPVEDPKRTLGSFAGGCIHLWRGASDKSLKDAPAGEIVDITEGIEDGLSVARAVPESRVLCAVSLSNVGGVVLPPAIKGVRLWRDNDTAPGAIAAFSRAAGAHLAAGREVLVVRVPDGLKDVNDLLRQQDPA